MYTFIHGQSAFTEVTLSRRRRCISCRVAADTRQQRTLYSRRVEGKGQRRGGQLWTKTYTEQETRPFFTDLETDMALIWGRPTWLDSHVATFSTTDERPCKRVSAVTLFCYDLFVITPNFLQILQKVTAYCSTQRNVLKVKSSLKCKSN